MEVLTGRSTWRSCSRRSSRSWRVRARVGEERTRRSGRNDLARNRSRTTKRIAGNAYDGKKRLPVSTSTQHFNSASATVYRRTRRAELTRKDRLWLRSPLSFCFSELLNQTSRAECITPAHDGLFAICRIGVLGVPGGGVVGALVRLKPSGMPQVGACRPCITHV